MNALPDLIVGDAVSIVVLYGSSEIIRDATLELLDLSVCLPEHKTVRTDKNESRFLLRVFGGAGILIYVGATCLAR